MGVSQGYLWGSHKDIYGVSQGYLWGSRHKDIILTLYLVCVIINIIIN